jgi:hypothetical protein
LLVVILCFLELLPGGVLAGDFPAPAIRTTARVAAKRLVGVQIDRQEALVFAGRKGFAPLEFMVDPAGSAAPLLRVQALADVAERMRKCLTSPHRSSYVGLQGNLTKPLFAQFRDSP